MTASRVQERAVRTPEALRRPGDVLSALFVASLLTAFALVVYWGHITDGGLYFDDWRGLDAHYQDPDVLDSLDTYHDVGLNARPLYAITWALQHEVLGLHTAANIGASVLGAALVSSLLALLIRQCGFGWRHGAAIGALLLVFPWADGLRLWPTAGHYNVSLSLVLLGATMSMHALARRDARVRLAWALAGGLAYVLAVLHYEQCAPLIAVMGLLYLRRATAKRALRMLAFHLAAAGIAVIAVLENTAPAAQSDVSGTLSHALKILRQAVELLGSAVVGGGPWGIGLALVALVVGGAVVAVLRLPVGDARAAALRRWLGVAGVGALAVLAGYATIAPASDWYVPLQPGQGTRVNAAAALGWAVLVYALAMLAAILAVRVVGRAPARTASAAALLIAVVIGSGWTARTASDARAWDAAWGIQQQVIALVKSAGPRKGSHFFLFGTPRATAHEVPVFIWPNDLGAALRLSLHDEQAWGAPIYDTTTVTCGRAGPTAVGAWIPTTTARYEQAYFVDLTRAVVAPIPDRSTCAATLGTMRPGPLALPGY